MPEQDPEADNDMQVMDWDGGEDLDAEFRNGDCAELEIDSGDDVPVESDDEDLNENHDEYPNQEIGVISDSQIYDDDDAQPAVDDALASVSHKDSVLSVHVCPTDRRALVTGGQDDVAVLWSVEERGGSLRCHQRCRLEGHTDSITQVAFSNDGMYVASGSYDGTVRIWAASSGALVHALDGPSKEIDWILWHPKGHAILAGSADTMAWMWWAPSGKLMQIFAGHAGTVTCGSWGLGGKLICTGSEDKSIIVWNPRAGTPQQHIKQVHESAVISICSHPESPLVVTGSEDAVGSVVHMENGKVIATLAGHMDSVECVGFNNAAPGGLLLLATGSMDGKVIVWDGKTFDLRCELKDHFERGGIVKFKWLQSPAYASWLCTCSTDSTLRLFNALSGECVRTLHGHRETVLDLDIALCDAPPGTGAAGQQLYVASGSDDNTCRLFLVALWTGGDSRSVGPPAAGTGANPADPLAAAAPATIGKPEDAAGAGPIEVVVAQGGASPSSGDPASPQSGLALPAAATSPGPEPSGATADRSPGSLPV